MKLKFSVVDVLCLFDRTSLLASKGRKQFLFFFFKNWSDYQLLQIIILSPIA